MCEELGFTIEQVRQALYRLETAGCVARVPPPPTYFFITDRGFKWGERETKTPKKRLKKLAEKRIIRKLSKQIDIQQPNHFRIGDVPNSVFAWR